MRIRIETRNSRIETATRRGIDEQIRLGLGREAASVERARATLGSGIAAHAPDLRTCRLRARLRSGGPDFVTATHAPDWSSAAREAAIQLGLRIKRHRQASWTGAGNTRSFSAARGWRRAGGGSA